jgi:tRNA pseudouridine55 synthase
VPLDGFLGIHKPSGCTSHDVVDRVRSLFGTKKVGHTGTLDPMATGVLVLCLGKFTRLSQFVTASDKKYRGVVRLGVETDSQDREGQVIARSVEVPPTRDGFEAVLETFLGKTQQIPPMHSAVRVGGKRLYELARKGQEIDRPGREIEIFGLEILAYQPPDLTLDVWCSKGTYVRTLASDVGRRLGCGAHLSGLERTAVGRIGLSDCHTLDELAEVAKRQEPVPFLEIQSVLDVPKVSLSAQQIQAFVNGRAVEDVCADEFEQAACVFDRDDRLIGMGRSHPDGLRPVCVIAQRES